MIKLGEYVSTQMLVIVSKVWMIKLSFLLEGTYRIFDFGDGAHCSPVDLSGQTVPALVER